MNDFTKEELEELIYDIEIALQEYGTLDKPYHLRTKIQSMIDNHCEHENTRNGDPCLECCDCGKQGFFNDNK